MPDAPAMRGEHGIVSATLCEQMFVIDFVV